MAEAPAAPATTGAEAQPAAPAAPAAPERPTWLPEKFKTPEDMAKSYSELEKKLGAKPAAGPQIPTPPSIPDMPDDAGISDIVKRAGLQEEDIAKTWQEKGDLTAEQYAAFRKQGIPKGAVKEYLQAQAFYGQQMVETALKEARDFAGGEEQHNNLLAWAGAGGIPAAEVEIMNAELAADPRKIVDITKRLYAEHIKAIGAGKAQPLINATATAQPQGGYTTQAEMLAAQRDKRYESDMAYKAAVNARIAATETRIIHGR